jgi:formylglycine-generating enzyme required for sulfatase activity
MNIKCRLMVTTMLLLALSTSVHAAGEVTNSIGMDLVAIEAGSFFMGSEGGDFDEQPLHHVTITHDFYMAATEVTNAQYELFDPAHKSLRGKNGFSSGDDEAVVFVSWNDAVHFCRWLSEKEGKTYRLPTEAEWEFACRAGSTTPFNTGDAYPESFFKHQETEWRPMPVSLKVAEFGANAWGLFDMHGNVEEWCQDWYGPYPEGASTNPVGYVSGDFKVARGGSHGTETHYLRSANRMGTLPDDRSWFIGFRVVQADMPQTAPLPSPVPQRWAKAVEQSDSAWDDGPDPGRPYFSGPKRFVRIPENSNGPLFSEHNHCPALTVCPNGDLLAIWYSTNDEAGRELCIAASRLRKGSEQWEPAAPFWDAPDRNDHASALLWDGDHTLFHFNGLGTDGTWVKLALIQRTSTDNGVTWSPAQFIDTEHELGNMPVAGAFITRQGAYVLPCDLHGSVVYVSLDQGVSWRDPSAGRETPSFKQGETGAQIAGIHAGVVELSDGTLMALGRSPEDEINGKMPMSLSTDMGKNWTYSASPFPAINGGQRLALHRLNEGPLLLISFTDSARVVDGPPERPETSSGMLFKDSEGNEYRGYGLFAALSLDEGKTWPIRKLITPGTPPQQLDGGAWTNEFTLDATRAEPMGYLVATQAPNGVIHLLSSAQHYAFNLAWLKQPANTPH